MAKRQTREESQMITRTKLLNAAEEEFSNMGFSGASVDRLTESAGFSRGAFYANYASKEDLFLALVEDRMNAIIADLGSLKKKMKSLRKNLF